MINVCGGKHQKPNTTHSCFARGEEGARDFIASEVQKRETVELAFVVMLCERMLVAVP
jgi:hypothetical protein